MDPYELAEPAKPRPGPRVSHGVVLVEHIACECEYDLFHIPLGGNCPECGRPVVASIKAYRRAQAAEAQKAETPIRWGRLIEASLLSVLIGVLTFALPNVWLRMLAFGLIVGVRLVVALVLYLVD